MGELRDMLERERDRLRMPQGALEDLRRRRQRKQRTQRILAGVIALALIGAAAVGLSVAALKGGGPATPMEPSPSATVAAPVVLQSPGVIDFVDASDGWAVWQGSILATSDGGKTWSGSYSGPIHVDELQFVDSRHGWALSRSDGTLLRTTDGVHWEAAGAQPQGLATFSFVTPSLGWGALGPDDPTTPSGLVRSSDGGLTWVSTHALQADAVCVAGGGDVVWVANPPSEGGTLTGSTDAGQSWTDRAIDILPGERWTPSLACAGSDAWVLYRGVVGPRHVVVSILYHTTVDQQRAVAVLQFPDVLQPRGLVPPTGSWVFTARDPVLGPLVALGDGVAFVVGTCPACGDGTSALYATTDEGASWIRHEIASAPEGGLVIGLSFVSAEVGFAEVQRSGSKGPEFHVLATDDGGATWREIETKA